jgi:hypothetical protein
MYNELPATRLFLEARNASFTIHWSQRCKGFEITGKKTCQTIKWIENYTFDGLMVRTIIRKKLRPGSKEFSRETYS